MVLGSELQGWGCRLWLSLEGKGLATADATAPQGETLARVW